MKKDHQDLSLHWKNRGEEDPIKDVIQRVIRSESIFVNREVLRADYVPNNLPHRQDQMRRLAEILSPSLKGSRPSNVFIYGKTGTGKTAVVRNVFSRLSKEALILGIPLSFSYINCRLAGTEYRVLAMLNQSIGEKIPHTGLSKAEVFYRFKSAISSKRRLVVACLDEVDVLVKTFGDNLLYELTRINEDMSLGRLSLVGVSNDLMFKDLLDPRVLSSLSEEEMVFPPYTAHELMDILNQRAALAFREGVISQGVINLCAALAASEHGDARRALDLLRVAAEVAERTGSKTVDEKHVRVAQGVIERGRIYEAVSTLPLHSKLVLMAILLLTKSSTNPPTSGEVFCTYRDLCSLAGVESLTDRRVSSLLSELDMLGVIGGEVVSLGRYGRTRRIRLLVPSDEISSVFERDEMLSYLLSYRPSPKGTRANERF